jgi:carboxylesterase
MLVIVIVIGIAILVATVSRLAARRWFESSNRLRHRRSAEGIVMGAEPIERLGEGDAGVLLLHGFGDTPQTVQAVADHLHALGYGVLAPLLPGHGRSLSEFVGSSASEWISASRSALERLGRQHSRVGIIGLSMGGAIAVILASGKNEVASLTLLSPYLTMPLLLRRLVRWRRVVAWLLPYFPGLGERSIQDEHAASKSLAYGALNAEALAELAAIVDEATVALPSVQLPVLMIQSREDNRIAEADARRSFDLIGSPNKKLVWISGSGHVITVDRERDRVVAEVAGFLETALPLNVRATRR